MNKARTAQRFRKKLVVVEAIYWDGGNWNEVCDFLGVPEDSVLEKVRSVDSDAVDRLPILIRGMEGDALAEIGDWILKGVGGFCVRKDAYFEANYEPVGDGSR